VKLEIWDTAGQERFRCITQSFYRGCMGILIVFDLTKRESFQNVEMWLRNLKSEASDKVIKMLVGNKLDLKREIGPEEVRNLIEMHKLPYIEVSAKTGENIEQVFETLATAIYKKFLVNEKDYVLDPKMKSNQKLIPTQEQTQTTNKKRDCCS